jgi:nuclear GTP-binding protein
LPHLPENTYFFSSKPYSPTAAGPSTSTASAVGRAELFAAIKQWSKTKSSNGGEGDVVVAMMGLPSVGKSALVNSLLPLSAPKQAVAEATPTGAAAKHPQPTTTAPVELAIDIGNGVKARIIDTPGWEFTEDEDEIAGMDDDVDGDDQEVWDKLEDRVAGDLLRRNLGRIDRVKDALPLGKSESSQFSAEY